MRRRKLIVRTEHKGRRWTMTLSGTDIKSKDALSSAVRNLVGQMNLIVVNGADPLLGALIVPAEKRLDDNGPKQLTITTSQEPERDPTLPPDGQPPSA